MAAGTKIVPSGNQLTYAASGISSGVTKGLLNVFTDIGSIAPSSGDRMFPLTFSSVEYAYYVNSGTYVGYYFINRNNPTGSQIWSNINASGEYKMGDFYNYIHWPTDNRYVTVLDNTSTPDDIQWVLTINGSNILDDTILASNFYDPSGGVPYYMAAGVGSAGAFSAPTINTGWNIDITLINTTRNQPTNVRVLLTDYNTGATLFFDNPMIDASTSWQYNNRIRRFDYYRIARWEILCT